MLDLFQTGAYARSGGGNQEIPQVQKPVVKWIAWNLDNGTDPPQHGAGITAFAKARAEWDAAGIANFPWVHCRNMADLQRLISVGEAKNAPAIGLNIEDVVGDKLSLQEVGGTVLDFWVNRYEKPVHMATLDWVQNGQGWQYLSYAVAALEFFPGEGSMKQGYNPTVAKQCIDHAHSEGLPKVAPMFKTKDLSASVYGQDFSICHSLYTADDITPTAQAWEAWKAPPCVPEGEADVLTPNEKKAFRQEIVAYCKLAERYESRWHYSQRRPYTGLGDAPQTYHVDDCSSYASLIFYWAARHTKTRVSDPLGYNYSGYGNTQSAIDYLDDHRAPAEKYRIGDMAIYGTRSNTKHMTICRKAGTSASSVWSSFGHEAGPLATTLHYRSDLVGVYRHPALL